MEDDKTIEDDHYKFTEYVGDQGKAYLARYSS